MPPGRDPCVGVSPRTAWEITCCRNAIDSDAISPFQLLTPLQPAHALTALGRVPLESKLTDGTSLLFASVASARSRNVGVRVLLGACATQRGCLRASQSRRFLKSASYLSAAALRALRSRWSRTNSGHQARASSASGTGSGSGGSGGLGFRGFRVAFGSFGCAAMAAV